MTTDLEESLSSIRLNPRRRSSEDNRRLCGSAHMEHSEPLLGQEAQGRETAPQKRSPWNTISSWKSGSTRRRGASNGTNGAAESEVPGRWRGSKRVWMYGVGILAVLGVVQLFTMAANLIVSGIPDGIHDVIGSWGKPGHIGAGLSHWPTDFTRDILPIPCHSHNDYWRTVPLYSAIEAGCIGVEADIWLSTGELYVGHSLGSLTPNRTLDSLYINPLLDILSKQNQEPLVIADPDRPVHGVFDTTPEQPLILLIDFKTSGTELFPYVVKALKPLRSKGYLTRQNGSEVIHGPIIVVGTGETPYEMVISDTDNPHRDIFFDAPLNKMYESPEGGAKQSASRNKGKTSREQSTEQSESWKRHGGSEEGGVKALEEAYSTSNSFYASVSFTETIGVLLNGEFSDHQLDILRGHIRGAHKRGLKARYWELPSWPINLRNNVWDVLVKEGVDLLNVDDLQGATQRDWSKHNGWWKRPR